MTKTSTLQKEFQERMDYDELLNCTRCGFCQPTCPTFIESNRKESSSPRGRIALMKAVVDGVIEPDEGFERELSLCLGCRACETACPSGVKYGQLLEDARAIVAEQKQLSFFKRVTQRFLLHTLIPNRFLLKGGIFFLWLYQKSGMQRLARKTKLLKLFSSSMFELEGALPQAPFPFRQLKSSDRDADQNVALFRGCIMDALFLETNQHTVDLLEGTGHSVDIPAGQTCCGALHAHAGDREKAVELAKENIRAFESGEFEQITTNAGGCGAFLVEYPHLLKDEPGWKERAAAFSAKIKDISSLVAAANTVNAYKIPEQKVTYQDSCHLKHGMQVHTEPRSLLRNIDGVDYVELRNAGMCCGSAGIYNLIEKEMSMQILDHKMEDVQKTGSAVIVTSNPGCLIQMRLGIKRAGLEDRLEAVHLVDLLHEAKQ
ncbi:(Fe-S)-binding protein [Alkalihalobacillus sp. TS-13]|uniref:(Fe-S)-binding protein n=1 Tax=Alkalihalobacillus sp. TS-13 TaxID=2842455 RepID=UPI001C87158E|nr:(Fe-S)-binding protein [Alkalihalobacillus sp. TS-13]